MSSDGLPRRLDLTIEPTPLRPAHALSRQLGVEIWFKRDDLTGLGLGGNKVRALEFLLADALDEGCDCLVTGAGPQSNWAALAAIAARTVGLDPHIVYYGKERAPLGNHLLADSVGASITFTGDPQRESVDATIRLVADALIEQGRRPAVLPRGGATAIGCLGYLRAAGELDRQLLEDRVQPTAVWLATGSCGTQAGLLAGARRLGLRYCVVGVTVSRGVSECIDRIATLSLEAGRLVGHGDSDRSDIHVIGDFIGPGYGRPSAAGTRAAQLVARTEGVLLDPFFGSKAMAALIHAVHVKALAGPVIFLVTGGAPTLFSTSNGL